MSFASRIIVSLLYKTIIQQKQGHQKNDSPKQWIVSDNSTVLVQQIMHEHRLMGFVSRGLTVMDIHGHTSKLIKFGYIYFEGLRIQHL